MREFLFLHWLYQRRENRRYCWVDNIDVDCFNCLKHNEICRKGFIPASFFYKKLHTQYNDCKRVLDDLEENAFIKRKKLKGGNYSIFYLITQTGIEYYQKFEQYYAINH